MTISGKNGRHSLLTLVGAFALMLLFAGFIGKTDVHATTKQITVQVQDRNGNDISNLVTELKVRIWETNEYILASEVEGKNMTYSIVYNNSYQDFLPVSFEVTAPGYKSTKVSSYNEANNNVLYSKDVYSQFCWYFTSLQDEQTVTIYLEDYPAEQQNLDYRKEAIELISAFATQVEYLDTPEPGEEYSDQEIVNSYVSNCENDIKKINLTKNVDEYKTEVDKLVDDAKDNIKQVPTKQSRMNSKYYDKIKFMKGTKEVGLTLSTTEDNQSSCSIHLHKFDQGGKFQITGISDSNIEWYAEDHNFMPINGIPQYTYYINNHADSKGTFMNEKTSLYDQKESVTLKDCYARFYDETGNEIKVTFELQVTTCTITEVTATLSDNIQEQNGVIQLERGSDWTYTTRIVNVNDAEANEPYTYSVTVTSSEEGYEGGYVISSRDETIATVKDGVIIPKRDGTCTFTVTSEDDASKSATFTLEFTLNDAEKAEKEAAQPVIQLISEIVEKGEITDTNKTNIENEINEAQTKYNNLADMQFDVEGASGLGAQKKVYNYDDLLEAEYRLEAYPVVQAINALGEIAINSDAAISTVRTSYEGLSEGARRKVTNIQTLVDAENTLAALKVTNLINQLNTIDANSGQAIQDARTAYNQYMVNYGSDSKVEAEIVTKLVNAENEFAALPVIALIEKLAPIDQLTVDRKSDIDNARSEYAKLSGDAQSKVTNYALLVSAESRLAVLQVEEQIKLLGTITSLDQKDEIDAARKAYLALSETQQKEVANIATLDTAEYKLAALEFEKKVDDVLCEAITIDNADPVEESIIALRQEYRGLDTNVIAQLRNSLMDEITEAEVKVYDVRAAEKVKEQLKKLSTTTVTLNNESLINEIRTAYNALSTFAKGEISGSEYAVLTAAESRIAVLKEAAKKAQEAANAQASTSTQTTQAPTTPAVTLSKITLKVKASKGKVKLTWKKSSKAQGYIIYRATKKKGTYKKIKVITKWKTTSYTDKKVKSKKQYFYKICPYKGTVTGPLSAAKKVKVK